MRGLNLSLSTLLSLVILTAGCSDSREVVEVRAGVELTRFLVGSLAGDADVDSILVESGQGLSVDREAIRNHVGDVSGTWEVVTADGVMDEDEIAALLNEVYMVRNPFPGRLSELPIHTGEPELEIMIDGSMTTYRRRVRASVAAIRSALESERRGDGLRYPVGTLIVGEHLDGDRVAETTVMRRRPDGYWDFGAYDENGNRTPSIEGTPDRLAIPSDCFGCHYGTRLFEPEKSFPAMAPPGPSGPRGIHVPQEWRNGMVIRGLDEHARREDGVLGPYTSIWVSALIAGADTLGTVADRTLVQALGY